MGSRKLVVCDPEEKYASALAEYILGRKEFAFQVQICSGIEELQTIQRETGIHDLLVSAEYSLEERENIEAERKFVLTSSGGEMPGKGEICIYKYQSGEAIFMEIVKDLGNVGSGLGEIFLKTIQKEKAKIFGVFSPVHRSGRTTYALNLARKTAGRSEVLYVNLEIYGGHGGHFPENRGQTLADVLYYARQESSNLYLFLSSVVNQMDGFDYICPVNVSEDIKAVSGEEWISLIRKIMEESIYETVILDLDEGLQGIYDILRLCTEIHVPVIRDPISLAKVHQFEQELNLLGYEDISPRIVKKEQKL